MNETEHTVGVTKREAADSQPAYLFLLSPTNKSPYGEKQERRSLYGKKKIGRIEPVG